MKQILCKYTTDKQYCVLYVQFIYVQFTCVRNKWAGIFAYHSSHSRACWLRRRSFFTTGQPCKDIIHNNHSLLCASINYSTYVCDIHIISNLYITLQLWRQKFCHIISCTYIQYNI